MFCQTNLLGLLPILEAAAGTADKVAALVKAQTAASKKEKATFALKVCSG